MGRCPWRPSTYSFVCDLYKHSGTSLCPIAWEVFEIWASKTLTKSSPPLKICFNYIWHNMWLSFYFIFICDLNKQSGTSLLHSLYTDFEISALKTLTKLHFFLKFVLRLVLLVFNQNFFRLWPVQAKCHQLLPYPVIRFRDLSIENPY